MVNFSYSVAIQQYYLHSNWLPFDRDMMKTLEHFRAGIFFLSGFGHILVKTEWNQLVPSVGGRNDWVLSYYSAITAHGPYTFCRMIITLRILHLMNGISWRVRIADLMMEYGHIQYYWHGTEVWEGVVMWNVLQISCCMTLSYHISLLGSAWSCKNVWWVVVLGFAIHQYMEEAGCYVASQKRIQPVLLNEWYWQVTGRGTECGWPAIGPTLHSWGIG